MHAVNDIKLKSFAYVCGVCYLSKSLLPTAGNDVVLKRKQKVFLTYSFYGIAYSKSVHTIMAPL